MWILVATLCVLTSPVDVECRKEASRPQPELAGCRAMIAPTLEYMTEQAGEAGAVVVFSVAACRFGDVI